MGERLTTCGRRRFATVQLHVLDQQMRRRIRRIRTCVARSTVCSKESEISFFVFVDGDDQVFAATRLQQVEGSLRCGGFYGSDVKFLDRAVGN
ncbi:hypothetical protein AVEN_107339-1 [Araneus ventricosus]|uniref:Uncharacterized protein n=1 Tax=Araneus ventricosus TaxID=182803 RepID=A0A4Y2HR91_ARAVE|nr:hypothetical protein AVEN_107339-1 [Araneus ventricosus]